MSYREDLDALAHRCQALEQKSNATTEELREAREMLAQAQANRRVSVLDNLHVAAPCKADWAKMTGDDRARHCAQCDKNVFDLSSLTRPEAEALIISKEGKLCVRFYQRADGTVLTADCPDGLVRRNRKRRVMAAAFGAMGAAAALAGLRHRAVVYPTMGAVAMPVQPDNGRGQALVEPAVEPPVLVMGDPAMVPQPKPVPKAPQKKACRFPSAVNKK